MKFIFSVFTWLFLYADTLTSIKKYEFTLQPYPVFGTPFTVFLFLLTHVFREIFRNLNTLKFLSLTDLIESSHC